MISLGMERVKCSKEKPHQGVALENGGYKKHVGNRDGENQGLEGYLQG
jgi:hypothetical protein